MPYTDNMPWPPYRVKLIHNENEPDRIENPPAFVPIQTGHVYQEQPDRTIYRAVDPEFAGKCFAGMLEELPEPQIVNVKGQKNYREYNWLNQIRDARTPKKYAYIKFTHAGERYMYGWINRFTEFTARELAKLNTPEGCGIAFRSEPFDNPSDCREEKATRSPKPYMKSKHPEAGFLRDYRTIDKIERWALGMFYSKLPSRLHKHGTLPEVLHIYMTDRCKPSGPELRGPGAGEPITIPRKAKRCGDLESHAIEWIWKYAKNPVNVQWFCNNQSRNLIARAAKKNQKVQQGIPHEDWTKSKTDMQSGKTPIGLNPDDIKYDDGGFHDAEQRLFYRSRLGL